MLLCACRYYGNNSVRQVVSEFYGFTFYILLYFTTKNQKLYIFGILSVTILFFYFLEQMKVGISYFCHFIVS